MPWTPTKCSIRSVRQGPLGKFLIFIWGRSAHLRSYQLSTAIVNLILLLLRGKSALNLALTRKILAKG